MSLVGLLKKRASVHRQYNQLATCLGLGLRDTHRIIYMLYQRDLIPTSLKPFANLISETTFNRLAPKDCWQNYNQLGAIAHVSLYNEAQCEITSNYLGQLNQLGKLKFTRYCDKFNIQIDSSNQTMPRTTHSNYKPELPAEPKGGHVLSLPRLDGPTLAGAIAQEPKGLIDQTSAASPAPTLTVADQTKASEIPRSMINQHPYTALVIEQADDSNQAKIQHVDHDPTLHQFQRGKSSKRKKKQGTSPKNCSAMQSSQSTLTVSQPGIPSFYKTINDTVGKIDDDNHKITPHEALSLAVYAAECGDIQLMQALCTQHYDRIQLLYGICRESNTLVINIAMQFFHFDFVTYICEQTKEVGIARASATINDISLSAEDSTVATILHVNGRAHPIITALAMIAKSLSQPVSTSTANRSDVVTDIDETLTKEIMHTCIHLIEHFEFHPNNKDQFCLTLVYLLRAYPEHRRPLLSPLFQSIFNNRKLCAMLFDYSCDLNRKSKGASPLQLFSLGLSLTDLLGSNITTLDTDKIHQEIDNMLDKTSAKSEKVKENLEVYLLGPFEQKNFYLLSAMVLCFDLTLKSSNTEAIAFRRLSIQYFVFLLDYFMAEEEKIEIVHGYLENMLQLVYGEENLDLKTREELCNTLCRILPQTRAIRHSISLDYLLPSRTTPPLVSLTNEEPYALFGTAIQVSLLTKLYVATKSGIEVAHQENRFFLNAVLRDTGVFFFGIHYYLTTKDPQYLYSIRRWSESAEEKYFPLPIYLPIFETILRNLINISQNNQAEHSPMPFVTFCIWLLRLIIQQRIIIVNPGVGNKDTLADSWQAAKEKKAQRVGGFFQKILNETDWKQTYRCHIETTMCITLKTSHKPEQEALDAHSDSQHAGPVAVAAQNKPKSLFSKLICQQLESESLHSLWQCAKSICLQPKQPQMDVGNTQG